MESCDLHRRGEPTDPTTQRSSPTICNTKTTRSSHSPTSDTTNITATIPIPTTNNSVDMYSPFRYEGQIFKQMSGRPQISRRRQHLHHLRESAFRVADHEHYVQLAVAVPGIKGRDVSVDVQGSSLTISGVRRIEEGGCRKRFKFTKGFSLDPSLDTSKMTANWSEGIVTVSAPRLQQGRIRPATSKSTHTRMQLSSRYYESRDDFVGCPKEQTREKSSPRDNKENHRDQMNC